MHADLSPTNATWRSMSRHKTKSAIKRPPEGSHWVYHTHDLIASAAWRGQSINCRRLIEFLECEHLSHGGNENGNLVAPYSQLVAAGITRRLIHATIHEAECRGLIRVERGGRRGMVMSDLNRFRLAYLWSSKRINGLWDWKEPTHEWANFQGFHRKKAASISPTIGTFAVSEGKPPQGSEGEQGGLQAFEMPSTRKYPNRNSFLYSGEGTHTPIIVSAGAAQPWASTKRDVPDSSSSLTFRTLGDVAHKSIAQLDATMPDKFKSWAPSPSKQNLADAAWEIPRKEVKGLLADGKAHP